jgi:hypothetical protein
MRYKVQASHGRPSQSDYFQHAKVHYEHLLEKLDPSYYTPSDEDGDETEDEEE